MNGERVEGGKLAKMTFFFPAALVNIIFDSLLQKFTGKILFSLF